MLKIPLVTGRAFSRADLADTQPVALINLEMARRYWPGEVEPLGQRIKLGEPDAQAPWREVVGIVGNVQGSDPLTPPPPRLYVPLAQQTEHAMAVVVRTTGDPAGLVEAVREEVRQADRRQAVYDRRLFYVG